MELLNIHMVIQMKAFEMLSGKTARKKKILLEETCENLNNLATVSKVNDKFL